MEHVYTDDNVNIEIQLRILKGYAKNKHDKLRIINGYHIQ